MNSSPKSMTKRADRVTKPPLAGEYVASVTLPGKGDLFDWVELMEAVDALCPVWPERDTGWGGGKWRL